MYIIIVGAGEVGGYLARILTEEQHDVAIVESDEEICRGLDSQLDALVVHGSGVSHHALERAGIRKADLVIAVTEVDEVNLIACMTANRIGDKPMTVARVRDDEYLLGEGALSAQELGLSLLVGPERAVAAKVVDLLRYEGAGERRELPGDLTLLELPLSPDSPLVHDTLADLADVIPPGSLVVGARGPRGMRIPHGTDRLAVDERAYVLTEAGNIDELVILSGKPWHHVHHVLIVGCGNIGFHLSKELERQRLFPSIVESDRSRAAWVAKNLTKSLVRHGDGTDPEFLKELLDENKDAVVVLIDDDEKAVLIGLLAKHLGAKKVVVRADKLAYAPIAHSMGIDSMISPRRAVANSILRFVRRGRIASAFMLGDHEAEILQLSVPPEPRHKGVVGVPLRDIEFPAGSLIGAVIRDGKGFVATGKTELEPGDDLLVVTTPNIVHKVERLLE